MAPDDHEHHHGDEPPGVPGFRTWRGVYWFVFGFFIVVVIALTIFSRVHG